ncbi:hypothetical protein CDV36_014889, partial [Fusarium kuroshium]
MNSEHGHACAARGEDSAHTRYNADPSFQRSARPETPGFSTMQYPPAGNTHLP